MGNVCSGMMTETWAYARLPWKFILVFWCENDAAARAFIHANAPPGAVGFMDVMSDEFLEFAPPCHIFTGGFPCQSFSGMGKNLGTDDPRGIVVVGILRYVKKNTPAVVVLENVLGLVTRHRPTLDGVVSSLRNLGYIVSWDILDTCVHGAIPQRRRRVYIVGIRWREPATGGPAALAATGASATDAQIRAGSMEWPQPIACPTLDAILDDAPKEMDYDKYPIPNFCDTKKQNLQGALAKVKARARRQDADPATYPVIADVCGSKVAVAWNLCPCITRSRGGQFAFWSLQHNRPLSIAEMCKLQGMLEEDLKIIISPAQMGLLLGNGFTAIVLARVLGAAIQAAERCQSVGQNPVAHPSGHPLLSQHAATNMIVALRRHSM